MIEQFPAPAINCFTGSLIRLSELNGRTVLESEVLERGDGYLLRAGWDEWGYPEYTFAVQDCGVRGMTGLGCSVRTVGFAGRNPVTLLAELVAAHRGAVVWTNSAHLSYAEVYSNSPGYLHAVLVTEVAEDLSRVQVYDSLVVDRTRYGCRAWLPAEDFTAAVTDRVRTETYDHMGYFHVIDDVRGSPAPRGAELDLRRQAGEFFEQDHHRRAVTEYHQLCMRMFQEGERATAAARRLFDHINVLYVLPNRILLGRSLDSLDGAQEAAAHCVALVDHWRALSVLALKFEATGSAAVLSRVDTRFQRIEKANTAMWSAIRALVPADSTPGEAVRR